MLTESEISRRDFLKNSAKTGAGLPALSGITFITHSERVFGANERVQAAVCGLCSMGFGHVQAYGTMKDAVVAAVCEVDEIVLNQRLAEMDKMGMPLPKTFIDGRKLMDDKSIATPNDWHSLMGIWACQAAKDVYVEKPCSHNWWEGHQLVLAANKYNRIVQHGTQSRSGDAIIEAVQKCATA